MDNADQAVTQATIGRQVEGSSGRRSCLLCLLFAVATCASVIYTMDSDGNGSGSGAQIEATRGGEKVLVIPIGLTSIVLSVASTVFLAMIWLFMLQRNELIRVRDKVDHLSEVQSGQQSEVQGIRETLARDQQALLRFDSFKDDMQRRLGAVETHLTTQAQSIPSLSGRALAR